MALDNVAAQAKKAPTVIPDHGDATHHDGTAAPVGNKLEQEGVLGAWTKDLLKEGKAAWHGLENLVSGNGGDKANIQHVNDVNTLTFDNVYGAQATAGKAAANTTDGKTATGTTDGKTATATTDGTQPKTAAQNDASLASWVSNMEKSLGGSNVAADAQKGFDWLFHAKEGDTSKTVSAKDGVATVNETNGHGVNTDVHATKGYINGEVGAAHIDQNKTTHETKYTSTDGQYQVDVNGPQDTVKGNNGDTFQWNSKTQQGDILGKDGKPILSFDSAHNLTEQLTPHSTLTQTNGDAGATADTAKAQNGGQPPEQDHVYADNKGNYALLRRDGLEVKTSKDTGVVTLEKDGHTLRVWGGKVEAQVPGDDGKQHWVPLQQDQLPNGMKVSPNGQVTLNGETIVDGKGNVHSSDNTTIDPIKGALTTTSDHGTVTATNDNNKTTVTNPGVGTITNDGKTYVNSDPSTQNIFKDWDPGNHSMDVMGGPGQSGVHLDTNPGGGLTMTESNGQNTSIFGNGVIQAFDDVGNFLFGTNNQGDATFGDGTQISNTGLVSDSSGSASAWGSTDDGSSASDQISDATAATSFATDGTDTSTADGTDPATGAPLTADVTADSTDPTNAEVSNLFSETSNIAALDTENGDLNSLISQYSAKGRTNIVGQLQAAEGKVQDTENNLESKLATTEKELGITPVVAKLMTENGLTREQAMKKLAGHDSDSEAA